MTCEKKRLKTNNYKRENYPLNKATNLMTITKRKTERERGRVREREAKIGEP